MIEVLEVEGVWRAEVRSRDRLGNKRSLTASLGSEREARAWVNCTVATLADEADADLTLARLVMTWHDDRVDVLRDTTIARESSMLMTHIAQDPIGLLDARTITRSDAATFARKLATKPNRRGGHLAPKTRRSILKALRQAVDSCEQIDNNVFARLRLPSLGDEEMAFLDRDEIRRLLVNHDAHRWGWAFALILLSGLRRSEFCGLQWPHIDLDNRNLDVRWRRTTARADVVEGPPKTRRSRRRIPLDPLAVELLLQRASTRDRDRIAWRSGWCPDGDTYVFALEDGTLPHPDRLTSEFARFSQKIGIHNVGIHGLRHTFAAVAIAAGVSGYAVSRAMGHSTVSFTFDRYGHLFDGGLSDEMAKVSVFLHTGEGPS